MPQRRRRRPDRLKRAGKVPQSSTGRLQICSRRALPIFRKDSHQSLRPSPLRDGGRRTTKLRLRPKKSASGVHKLMIGGWWFMAAGAGETASPKSPSQVNPNRRKRRKSHSQNPSASNLKMGIQKARTTVDLWFLGFFPFTWDFVFGIGFCAGQSMARCCFLEKISLSTRVSASNGATIIPLLSGRLVTAWARDRGAGREFDRRNTAWREQSRGGVATPYAGWPGEIARESYQLLPTVVDLFWSPRLTKENIRA